MGLLKKIFGKKAAKEPPPRQFPQIATSKEANDWLAKAVRGNDLPLAEWALKAMASPNILIDCGLHDGGYSRAQEMPLLTYAVTTAHLPMVNLLLQYGAEVDRRYQGATPLMNAVCIGETPIVRALLDAGADLRLLCERICPLDMARQRQFLDIIKMLEDEPQHRKNVVEAARREHAEAEARRLAEIEKAKQEALNPKAETKEAIAVMKPISLKSRSRESLPR
jgi:ankyrin repeat protein